MNAVEIEEAISQLVEAPFDKDEFPYQFLEAFGNKSTTIKKLKSGTSNKSDVEGGVLQYNNIHMAICNPGETTQVLTTLKNSSATTRHKAKFILSTDGSYFEAEDLNSGETIACEYQKFPEYFGFFLSLAGISTVKQIRENSFDIRATSRLNKLYLELLTQNPEWGTEDRRHDLNHFMARLIFCFFAEDTNIFRESNLFTSTIDRMSERDASNTHDIISEIFKAMNTHADKRKEAGVKRWADPFPYVNGGLFSGSIAVPKFSKIARSYLLHVGSLDWQQINPDIFGSMIQAVADDEERGSLGMHYTSVPNILKVLNPLFLDDFRTQLEEAGDNSRKLLNLRNRLSKIRVFDPACGSGNFLVIAYKEMRKIEYELNKRRNDLNKNSVIPLTNYRGIELRDFSAEIARLALIIAEFQCDVLYLGQKLALAEFLPLGAENWITCGNALKTDWLSVCPPTDTSVKLRGDDLFSTPLDQTEIDFENEGGETYICGNPPYLGSSRQNNEQKKDLENIFSKKIKSWKNLDYIAGWFVKASSYIELTNGKFAFVSTNSICQGQQVPLLWPLLHERNQGIIFAHLSFKWNNLASHNAGVTVIIIGVSNSKPTRSKIFSIDEMGCIEVRSVKNINPYLIDGENIVVTPIRKPYSDKAEMFKGNQPSDGGNLCLSRCEKDSILESSPEAVKFIKRYLGAADYIQGKERYCLWINDSDIEEVKEINAISLRLEKVVKMRRDAVASTTRIAAEWPHKFIQIQRIAKQYSIIFPRICSEKREFLPVGILDANAILSDQAFALYDTPLWNLSLGTSRIHLVWIATVCGKLKTDFRYSNTLGWNTFPVPKLTEKNKADLTKCAEDILLAREAHFPATIADLYKPDQMPENLRQAHNRNDEVLERIYIGRRFKNDTERLEKLFELYTKMTANQDKTGSKSI